MIDQSQARSPSVSGPTELYSLPVAGPQPTQVAGQFGEIRDRLRSAYLHDSRPWVVAYSGGKDSTLVLQLVIETLEDLGKVPVKPVYILSSDTRVEAPNVVSYVEDVHAHLRRYAASAGIPLETRIVRPNVEQAFWSKLIGKGYPSPTRWFRWCTTNMKIKPSRSEIETIVSEHGSVILLLGSRMTESRNRQRAMSGRTLNHRKLNPHDEIPNAYVMTPIAQLETDRVWEYLFENNPPPWGRPHDDMLELYRQANGGECPVVMDLNTPSCGGSRFGCWTCTVVRQDRSMEGFLDSGEQWMLPLNEFRNWLKEIRESEHFREPQRRTGENRPGPFTAKARMEILRRLLDTERQVQRELIRDEEIVYIQNQWDREFDVAKSAMAIASEYGRVTEMQGTRTLDQDEMQLVADIAAQFEVNEEVIIRLFALEDEYPDLRAWGAKANFRRRVADVIKNAARQIDVATERKDEV